MGTNLIYLDTFGASGGVGRVTRELVPALSRFTPVSVAGCSHVVASLRGNLPADVPLHNLTPAKASLRRLSYEIAKRKGSPFKNLSTYLLSVLRKRFPLSPLLVNFPQLLSPPRETLSYSLLIYDLNWLSYPENFERPKEIDSWCRQWCGGADFIFCISEFIRTELIERYGTSLEKTVATPLAPFVNCGTSFPDAAVLQRFGLHDTGFFLYPSVFGLHKGHDLLVTSLKEANRTLPVVLTCGRPELASAPSTAYGSYLAGLSADFAALEADGKLVILQGLTDAEMSTLRQKCRAFVLPSRYEGYGFPFAEAITLGKPVIRSEIPAFQEIAERHCLPGNDQCTFTNVMELTALLQTYSHSPPPTVHMSAVQWSWLDCAKKIHQCLIESI